MALTALGHREGATLFMVLMAAFDLLLSTYSGRDVIAVSFPEAGRQRPETEQLVGYFVNNLVVRSDLSGDPSFVELVQQVRERTLDAYTHQGVPLWSLDGVIRQGRDPFRIVFNLLNATVPTLDLHGLQASPLESGTGYVFAEVLSKLEPADVDLALIMREDDGDLRGIWLYALERVDAHGMAVMMRQWAHVIDLVVAHPDCGVQELRRRLRQRPLAASPTSSTTLGERA
jgi:non-ribosomal peptide synthetase component F